MTTHNATATPAPKATVNQGAPDIQRNVYRPNPDRILARHFGQSVLPLRRDQMIRSNRP